MKSRTVSTVCLTAIVYGTYLIAFSGPPLRVQLSVFLSLAVGFTLPALFVENLRQHFSGFWRTALLQVAGCVVLEVLFSIVIVKWEFRLVPVLVLIGLGFLCLELLLLIHASILTLHTHLNMGPKLFSRKRKVMIYAGIFGALLLAVRGVATIPSIQDSLCRLMSKAVYRDSTADVVLCLVVGANPNRSVHGCTPAIHAAAALDRVAILKLLLVVGADPNLKTKFDVTPLWEAQNRKAEAAATILREAGGYAYISPNAP